MTRARSTSTKICRLCQLSCSVQRSHVAYLALSHCPQRLDNRELRLEVGSVVEERHDNLHHLGGGLLELSMLLRKQENLLVHKVPVICLFGYCDNGDDDPRGRCKIRSLRCVSVQSRTRDLTKRTWRVFFSSGSSWSMAACGLLWNHILALYDFLQGENSPFQASPPLESGRRLPL